MDVRERVDLLGQAAEFDLYSAPGCAAGPPRVDLSNCISSAAMPGGRRIKVLKVLLSNMCENDCAYCAIRASRDTRRAALKPHELARAFDQMRRAGLVSGLFLSSGICHSSVREMDRMIVTVEILREVYAFQGYVHLKVLPGAEPAQIERAAQLADRVSTNLEAPNPERLARLSQRKAFDAQLMPALRVASRLHRQSGRRLAPSGVTTQLVVGAAGESDCEILSTTSRLYRELGLARAYYSAFRPIEDTPLENHPPTPPLRQHRLYQSDFLLRQYGFRFEELVFDAAGNLPASRDPKLAWADAHPERFPVEVNLAGREELLRVPGIGPLTAGRILDARRSGRLTELAYLRTMGVDVGRAAPYILLDGRRPEHQLSLWTGA